MPQPRLSMRKIRETLRLAAQGISQRQVALSVGVARATVGDCLARARTAGLSWPLSADLDDAALEALLYPPQPHSSQARPLPDCATLHKELRRKGVTLLLLWQEYKAAHPDGVQYSRFCEIYRAWEGRIDPVLRQQHRPGDKLFVDYAGVTVDVVDKRNGEIRPAQIFVASLGYSNYTYCEATWSQKAEDWVGSHVRALSFFGGVPAAIVPDNLKSGVTTPHRYDPVINPAYAEFAAHYDTTILPARPRKPRDKAKVETAVQIVERQILAPLRKRTFFSLAELNAAIAQGRKTLNDKPFQKLDGCRASWFAAETLVMKPLPPMAYEFATWKTATVHMDYHIDVGRHYYSVPHTLIRKKVEVRLTSRTLEIFFRGRRVASHVRSATKGGYTTVDAHRPDKHREHLDQYHQHLLRRAEAVGAHTVGVLRSQMLSRRHPDQAVRNCKGILRLADDYSPAQLEAACQQALALNSTSYRSIAALIRNPNPPQTHLSLSLPSHDNLRGPGYYN